MLIISVCKFQDPDQRLTNLPCGLLFIGDHWAYQKFVLDSSLQRRRCHLALTRVVGVRPSRFPRSEVTSYRRWLSRRARATWHAVRSRGISFPVISFPFLQPIYFVAVVHTLVPCVTDQSRVPPSLTLSFATLAKAPGCATVRPCHFARVMKWSVFPDNSGMHSKWSLGPRSTKWWYV